MSVFSKITHSYVRMYVRAYVCTRVFVDGLPGSNNNRDVGATDTPRTARAQLGGDELGGASFMHNEADSQLQIEGVTDNREGT